MPASAMSRRRGAVRVMSRSRRGCPAVLRRLAAAKPAAPEKAPEPAPASAVQASAPQDAASRQTGFGSRSGITPEDMIRMAEMRRGGVGIARLCETFGTSRATVYRILAGQGLGRRQRRGEA